MPTRVLHVLGTAQREAASIAGIVESFARATDPGKYDLEACFLLNDGPWVQKLRSCGVTAFHVPWSGLRDVAGGIRFWRFVSSRSPDVVHVHYGGRSARGLIRRATGAPIIVHLHGRVLESGDMRVRPIDCRGADAVIGTSRAVADVAVHDRKFVVPPSVTSGAPPGAAPSRVTTIGAAGRLVAIKDMPLLLRAFALLLARQGDLRLEIAGDGPERIRLEDMAGELGIAERVTFLGWQAEISTSISRWQLFVQPSHEEALGITILQAMAAGVPVVAMAVGGIPEIVVPGQTGWLVRERSPEVFAAVMRQAMDAREEREQVTKRAFELIEREFLPDKLVERLSGIYSQLVVQPARGRSAGA